MTSLDLVGIGLIVFFLIACAWTALGNLQRAERLAALAFRHLTSHSEGPAKEESLKELAALIAELLGRDEEDVYLQLARHSSNKKEDNHQSNGFHFKPKDRFTF